MQKLPDLAVLYAVLCLWGCIILEKEHKDSPLASLARLPKSVLESRVNIIVSFDNIYAPAK